MMHFQLIVHILTIFLQIALFKSSSSAVEIGFQKTPQRETLLEGNKEKNITIKRILLINDFYSFLIPEGATYNQTVCSNGTCSLIGNCPEYKKFLDAGVRPRFCGWIRDGRLRPMICCPSNIKQFEQQFPIEDQNFSTQKLPSVLKVSLKDTKDIDDDQNVQKNQEQPLNSESERITERNFLTESSLSAPNLDLINETIFSVFGPNPDTVGSTNELYRFESQNEKTTTLRGNVMDNKPFV